MITVNIVGSKTNLFGRESSRKMNMFNVYIYTAFNLLMDQAINQVYTFV